MGAITTTTLQTTPLELAPQLPKARMEVTPVLAVATPTTTPTCELRLDLSTDRWLVFLS